jgi:hypothetical protein
VPPYAPGAPPIRMTFLADGSRATSPEGARRGPAVAFLGGSYTQGWAVSDDETFPWRIQERFPSLDVRNYGTSGYGTLQSLLVMERILAGDPAPGIVLYGFIGHHEIRNVAHPAWLRMLAAYATRGHVETPYCTLDQDGGLERHPPIGYPGWPLHERLATVAFLESAYADLEGRERAAQARAVTERLMVEMGRLAVARDVRFAVVLLNATREVRAHYEAFLRSQGIDFLDCVHPLRPELLVPGEIHPNGRLHGMWADCIEPKLRSWLDDPDAQAEGRPSEDAGDRRASITSTPSSDAPVTAATMGHQR